VPVDPQLVDVLRQVDDAPAISTLPLAEGRERFRRLSLLAASAADDIEVGAVEDTEVPGGAGPLRARIYRPKADSPCATLAFFHGGGFTIGDLDTHDRDCRTFCDRVGATVVSTEYRLAPENPFPAAAEDAIAATRWIGESFPHPLVVAGDSAGGNLAAVAAQHVEGLAAQVLIYPATDLVSERPSHQENGHGYFLTIEEMEWFHSNYLPDHDAGNDPLASPLHAPDLTGVPPAIVVTAEFDPLRDDGDAYAAALQEAGVKVVHRRFEGLVHGFFGFAPLSAMARDAVDEVCKDLRELLGC
jgi:acetyl esterase